MSAPLANADVVELLSSWQRLNADLLQLSESAVRQLLAEELRDKRRAKYVERLHHRFNRLRMLRERHEVKRGFLSF